MKQHTEARSINERSSINDHDAVCHVSYSGSFSEDTMRDTVCHDDAHNAVCYVTRIKHSNFDIEM